MFLCMFLRALFIICRVRSVFEGGAILGLLEYGGIDGMAMLEALSRRRIRTIAKLVKVGAKDVSL